MLKSILNLAIRLDYWQTRHMKRSGWLAEKPKIIENKTTNKTEALTLRSLHPLKALTKDEKDKKPS